MKPPITMDSKDMSTAEMAPVQIFQKETLDKKGFTGKHVLVAVSSVLALAVLIGGFVSGFYVLKQISVKHSENMTKLFTLRVNDGETVVNENIKTNVNEKTTEIDITDDKGQHNIVYNDFKKGITVFVTGGANSACYVSPMNKSDDEDPVTIEKYMETHPNHDIDARNARQVDEYMVPAEEPIPDTTFLGTNINQMCSGKSVYWMYPKQGNTGVSTRQKRSCEYGILRICRYYDLGYYYLRRCAYILYEACD